ncbi:MAG: F0F1 ATP synthase subunit B [Thermodesulfobacteriota bacterium]
MKNYKRIFMALVVVALTAGVAVAAESGGDGDSSKWWNLFWRVINFVIFVGILYKIAGKRLKDFFTGRRYQIENEFKDLEKRRVDAEAKLKDVEKRIANLDQEREEILSAAKEQGEVLKQGIIEKAEKTAEQIREQARVNAEQEASQAIAALRAEMAEMVAGAAEQMVREKLTQDQHKGLINDYLAKVVLN